MGDGAERCQERLVETALQKTGGNRQDAALLLALNSKDFSALRKELNVK